MSAMSFNLSGTMVLLAYVLSSLIAENYHSQVHNVTREVPRIDKETLMILKPLTLIFPPPPTVGFPSITQKYKN